MRRRRRRLHLRLRDRERPSLTPSICTGTLPYYCTPHGGCCGMVGTVTVANASPTPTPTPTTPRSGATFTHTFNMYGDVAVLLHSARWMLRHGRHRHGG